MATDSIAAYDNEMAAVKALVEAYKALPANEHEDFPKMREFFEMRMGQLLQAMVANGRTKQEGLGSVLLYPHLGFKKLREANIARQAEWDPEGHIDLAYRGNELGGEAGEAQNIIKKIERERRGIRGSKSNTTELASELADVVICVDLICMQEQIDLERAVVDKFNQTSERYALKARLVP
jgi:NTP pyrophosphatase (non-canonical NTP hydrolase)